jgi:hypothetical protein
MKNRFWFVLVALAVPAAAWASSFEGTVAGVDPVGRTLSLVRSDNAERVTVLADRARFGGRAFSLAEIPIGSRVRVDAALEGGALRASAVDVTDAGPVPPPGPAGVRIAPVPDRASDVSLSNDDLDSQGPLGAGVTAGSAAKSVADTTGTSIAAD